MSDLTPEILLKAIENDLCQNSWKWLSSLSSQERKKQMSDYEKAYETEKSYWDSAIRSKERLMSECTHPDCKDKDSTHYFMCHMTQKEFEQRTKGKPVQKFEPNIIKETAKKSKEKTGQDLNE